MKRFGLLCLLVLGILSVAFPVTAEEPEPRPPRPHLRLPFLPGEGYVVTCGYGCYQHQSSMFYAVDFATPEGTPIVAAADGVVAAITWEVGLPLSKNLGDALILYLDHGGGWFTRYVHLSGVTVAVGDTVRQGDVIGYAGHTGAEGAHLHFELKYGTSLHAPSQPLDDLFGSAPPEVGQTYVATALITRPTPHAPLASPTPTPEARSTLSPGLTTPLVMPASPVLSTTTLAAGEAFTITLTLRNSGTTPLSLPIVGVIPQQQEALLNTLAFTRDVVLAPGETRSLDLPLSLPAGAYVLSPFAFSETYTLLPIGVTGENSAAISLRVDNQRVYVPLVAR